jgi:vancomycin resistance protein YoaR
VTAPIYVSGKKGTGTGGGVCQVSSTLYAAMVYAGLPATERHAHSLPVDYLPAGLDATIAGSYLDLKFTNTFSQPLLIQASANGGTLTVTLVLQ